MKRFLLASCVLLASFSAFAEENWTSEETASGLKQIEAVRYAFAGTSVTLHSLRFLDENCNSIDSANIVIEKRPEHGIAEIVIEQTFSVYPKDNLRFKCNDQKTPAIYLKYTANPGYAGRDQFTVLEVSNVGGWARERTFMLNVRSMQNAEAIGNSTNPSGPSSLPLPRKKN